MTAMPRQLSQFRTFFDLGIDKDETLDFATLYSIMGEATKKRTHWNHLAVKALRGDRLSEGDAELASRILNGSIYQDKAKFKHCRICSDVFERKVLSEASARYKRWEICYPTHPYYPGSTMVYLRDRESRKVENFQDLSDQDIDELIHFGQDMLSVLQMRSSFEVVGINILFQQISKSQACAHGHVEVMVKDPQVLDLGYRVHQKMPYDPYAYLINQQVKSSFHGSLELIDTIHGLRTFANTGQIREAVDLVALYEQHICKLVTTARGIQVHGLDDPTRDWMKSNGLSTTNAWSLIERLSPAPVNYVYLTFYRDRVALSLVPEMVLEPVMPEQITDDEIDLYTIKVNQYAVSSDFRLLRQIAPLIRPSLKLSGYDVVTPHTRQLTRSILSTIEGKEFDV